MSMVATFNSAWAKGATAPIVPMRRSVRMDFWIMLVGITVVNTEMLGGRVSGVTAPGADSFKIGSRR